MIVIWHHDMWWKRNTLPQSSWLSSLQQSLFYVTKKSLLFIIHSCYSIFVHGPTVQYKRSKLYEIQWNPSFKISCVWARFPDRFPLCVDSIVSRLHLRLYTDAPVNLELPLRFGGFGNTSLCDLCGNFIHYWDWLQPQSIARLISFKRWGKQQATG